VFVGLSSCRSPVAMLPVEERNRKWQKKEAVKHTVYFRLYRLISGIKRAIERGPE